MDVSDGRRVPHQIRQQGDEGQQHQHHVCRRCGWPFPNPHPSAKHRRAHKKNCGKIKGYIVLDASGKTNATDEVDGNHSSDRIDEKTLVVDSELAKRKGISRLGRCNEGGYGDLDVVNVLQSEDTSNSGYLPEDSPVQDHDMAVAGEQYIKDSESHTSVPICEDTHNFSSQDVANGCSPLTNRDEVKDEDSKTDNFKPVLQQQRPDPAFDSSTVEHQVEKMNSGVEIPSNCFENAIGIHEVLTGSGEIDLSHAGEETTGKACLDGAIISNSCSMEGKTSELVQIVTESAQSEQHLEDENIKCTIRCPNSLDFSHGKHSFFEDNGCTSSLSPVNSEEQANISFITMQLEKNDEPRHDVENGITTKKLHYDKFLDCRGNFEHSLMDDLVSESSLPDRMKANEVDINESLVAEENTFFYPEADSYQLDATPTESEMLEIMPENGTSTGHIDGFAVVNDIVAETRLLVEASQIAQHEDIETHGNNTNWNTINENREMIHAADELNPTYNSTESADTNYIDTYPMTMGNKCVPDEVLDHKSVEARFKAHIVEFDTKPRSSESEFVDEITDNEFQQHEEKISATIPGETESSNNHVTKSNFCVVESVTESTAVPPMETPNSNPTIQKDEEKECFLDRLIIHDDSKSIFTTEETTIGVSEQSLKNEVSLAKDQQFDAAFVTVDTSVDTTIQSVGVAGQWGSMSDVSHAFPSVHNDGRGENETLNQDELHIKTASNGSNEEPSDKQGEPQIEAVSNEIQMSPRPHEEAKVKNEDEEIVANVVNWNSEKSHTPLRNLLVQATLESKKKAGESPTLPIATSTTMNAQKTKAQASTGSPERKIGREEWDSPARLPARKNDKRFKTKSSWVPFICCSSLN